MIYVILLGIAAMGCGIYLSVMFSAIPGALEERLGVFDALPENIGEWYADVGSPEAAAAERRGLRREVRFLLHPAKGLFSRDQLVKQVRLRNQENEIVEVLPEETIKRKRKQVKA
jgi:hypothetical protein